MKRTIKWIIENRDSYYQEIRNELGIEPGDHIFIYGIHTLSPDKWYIGQTRSLYSRLFSGRSKNGHCEMVINKDDRSFIKDPENTEFHLLEWKLISEVADLDHLEEEYITKYDSFKSGYNKTKSGNVIDGSQVEGCNVYYNPNTSEIRYSRSDLTKEGFELGRTYNIGKSWYHSPDNKFEKMIDESEVPSDWIKGRLPGRGGNNRVNLWCYSYKWNSVDHYKSKSELIKEITEFPEAELRLGRVNLSDMDESLDTNPILTEEIINNL